MWQKIYDYLVQRPGGATASELLSLLFLRQGGHTVRWGERFLDTVLSSDPHFFYDSQTDRWYATIHTALHQSLLHATFAVLALETTGVNPRAAAIIEVAAIRLQAGRITEEFCTLVNPGRRVPAAITRLTGISDDLVRPQPSIEAVFPQFHHFLGSAVIVGHNVAFDLRFLNCSTHHSPSAPFLNPTLCTLRLAHRLFPQLRSRSLDALAAALGLLRVAPHRALTDARVTAEIFSILMEKLIARGISTVGQTLDFQHSARDGRRFAPGLPRSALASLPEGPGIYRLLDADGHLLYIGKAKNLRRRVSSYLTNSASHSNKVLDLVRHVHALTYEQTGSELEAALREADLIRTLKPPYNRASTHLPRVAFLKLDVANPYPRLALTAKPRSDRALYIGPFRTRHFAARAQRLLARLLGLRTCQGHLSPAPTYSPCLSGQTGACTAPCAARVSREAYRARVTALLRLLNGEDTSLRDTLMEKRTQLAAALRFESAARIHQDLQLLDRIVHTHKRIHWIVTRAHAFLLLPSREPGAAQAYLVLHGRLVASGVVHAPADLERFITLARERFGLMRDIPLRPEEIDASTILSAWLRDPHPSRGAVFPVDKPSTLEDHRDEIVAALHELQCIAAAVPGTCDPTPQSV